MSIDDLAKKAELEIQDRLPMFHMFWHSAEKTKSAQSLHDVKCFIDYMKQKNLMYAYRYYKELYCELIETKTTNG